ncbi:cation transporter [Devosia salina]|uniref:cation transporter n=1 Tax=Devosia salina TaxID=2860336 RepID=UPI001F0B2A39|nr:cation transporter [Devosia salina]
MNNLSDAGSVLVSYIAWRIAQRAANERRTFGYARAETVGALINLTTLIMIGLYPLALRRARKTSGLLQMLPTTIVNSLIRLTFCENLSR